MPKFDKKCGHCNTKFEIEISYTDTRDIECPKCGKSDRIANILDKPFTVIYKTSGFTKRVKKKNE